MAIRFEQLREGNALWSLAAACAAFSGGGDSDDRPPSPNAERIYTSGPGLPAPSSEPRPTTDYQQQLKYSARLTVSQGTTGLPSVTPGNIAQCVLNSAHLQAVESSSMVSRVPMFHDSTEGNAELAQDPIFHIPPKRVKSNEQNALSTALSKSFGLAGIIHSSEDDFNSKKPCNKPPANNLSNKQNGVCRFGHPGVDKKGNALHLVNFLDSDTIRHNKTNISYKTTKDEAKPSKSEFPCGYLEKNGGPCSATFCPTLSGAGLSDEANRPAVAKTNIDSTPKAQASVSQSKASQGPTKKVLENVTSRTLSEKFGETDAAEALLGLFTAIPPCHDSKQVDQQTTAECDLSNFKLSPNKERPTSPALDDHQEKLNLDKVGKANSCRASRFHYKKAICLKFANSLDSQVGLPCSANCKSATEHCSSPNGGKNGAAGCTQVTKDKAEQIPLTFGTFRKSLIKWGNVSWNQGSDINQETYDKKTPDSDRGKTKTNSSSFQKQKEGPEKCNKPLPVGEQPPAPRLSTRRRNTLQGRGTCLSQKSNLYRVTSSLGSSSESLCSSGDDANSVGDSDSESSQYTSESEEEDSCQHDDVSVVHIASPNVAKPPVSRCEEAVTKRPFMLRKPQFSLPNRNDGHFPNFRKKFSGLPTSSTLANFQIKSQFPVVSSVNFSRQDSESENCVKENESTQKTTNNAHIKKATFKFSSCLQRKDDVHESKKTLATDQSTLTLNGMSTLDTLRNSAFPLAKDQSKTKNKSTTASPDVSLESWPEFYGGASFETLSSAENFTFIKKSQLAGNPKITPKSSYARCRLPQPTARSPALEAKQLRKLKTTRKRKAIKSPELTHGNLKGETTTSTSCTATHHLPTDDLPADADVAVGCVSTESSRSSSLDAWSTESVTSSHASSVAGDDLTVERRHKSRRLSVAKRTAGASKKLRLGKKSGRVKVHSKQWRIAGAADNGGSTKDLSPLTGKASKYGGDDVGERLSPGTGKSGFKLMSCFPAPASLVAGAARGELLPGYVSSGTNLRDVAVRWFKGTDVTELKQKRQRERWRQLTLEMFCMGSSR